RSPGFDGRRWRSDGMSSGTSGAAALVSGGLALVMAAYPQASGNQVIQHLIRNPGGRVGPLRDLTFGFGVMSVTKMLASDPTQWPDVNPLLPGNAPETAGAGTDAGPVAGAGAGTDAGSDASGAVAANSGDGDSGGGGGAGPVVALGGVAALAAAAAVVVLVRRRPGFGGAPTGPGTRTPGVGP
ncbi:MAG: S8 family serine peptidase, partial [Sporichthyaceae bacterium]